MRERGVWYEGVFLQPYDKRTTDETRAQYNVPPLAEALTYEKHSKKLWK